MNKYRSKHILISGASIAGPALAYWLHQYGFHVTIVEKAPHIRKGGYRTGVRGAALQVIEQMGLLPQVSAAGTQLRGSSLVNNRGRQMIQFDDPAAFRLHNAQDMELMRSDLVQILYEATKDKAEYIFDDSVTGILQTAEKVHVLFRSSASRSFDMVIAADGLHSNVRNLVFGKESDFVTNLNAHIATFSIPDYFEQQQWEHSYAAAGKLVQVYRTEHGGTKAMFLFTGEDIRYDQHNLEQQRLIVSERFSDAGWEVSTLLKDMRTASDFYFDTVSQVYMDSLSEGRVALVGDAGYCPSPASGQGASLALVGAYVLAGELSRAHGDHKIAFAKYEEELQAFIKVNQELGIRISREMVPATRKQVLFQIAMLQLTLRIPGGRKWFRNRMARMMRTVDMAANAIRLKTYPATRKQYVAMAE